MNLVDLVNPEDFKSMQVEGSFFNLTSRSSLRKQSAQTVQLENGTTILKKTQDKETVDFTVCEILENGLVIEAPSHSCAQGHQLELVFSVVNAPKPVHIEARSKVKDIELIDNAVQRITIEFFKVDEEAWKQFCSLYSQAQEKVTDLFQSIRGY